MTQDEQSKYAWLEAQPPNQDKIKKQYSRDVREQKKMLNKVLDFLNF